MSLHLEQQEEQRCVWYFAQGSSSDTPQELRDLGQCRDMLPFSQLDPESGYLKEHLQEGLNQKLWTC